MKDHPTLMIAENVRAILDGRKTMTRRIIKLQPHKIAAYATKAPDGLWFFSDDTGMPIGESFKCPYKPGDRLAIKESYQIKNCYVKQRSVSGFYLADNESFYVKLLDREWDLLYKRKRPYAKTSGRFMYNSLCRLKPPIVSVRVERVQEISQVDIMKEGIGVEPFLETAELRPRFKVLWDSINAKRGICKTCKGHQVVKGWTGSLKTNSLMQTAEDCPDCDGPTGYSWDFNPWVRVVEFKRIEP